MKNALVVITTLVLVIFASSAMAEGRHIHVLHDDIRDQYNEIEVCPVPEGHNNRSGLGDGTNPGNGSDANNSGNDGTDNPNNAKK